MRPRAVQRALAALALAVLVSGAGCGGGGAVAPPSKQDRSSSPALAAVPEADFFVAPGAPEGTPCTRAEPCGSPDRAYHLARPGQAVELAAGEYGDVTFTADPTKPRGECALRARWKDCVVVRARGPVRIGALRFGDDYARPGPTALALVAGAGGTIRAEGSAFNQVRDVATWNIRQRNLYVTGGRSLAVRGGEVGGVRSPDGTHPEIQRVYGSRPLVVPQELLIEGVRFHDINTTDPRAHVDCLQIENGRDIVIRGNTFERCGSVGLRLSYGADSEEGPPTDVLIERNRFGRCADTPVSPCYYAAALGVGHHVVVRDNHSDQMLQQTGDARFAHDVHYVGNRGPGIACEPFVRYRDNAWTAGTCEPASR